MPDPRTEVAANNARWCDLVVRALGGVTTWQPDHWAAGRRTPDGYPDAVTLAPGTGRATVLARVDGGPGCSVKDSFADLDLAPSGFQVLFEAMWIRHQDPVPGPEPALRWQQVASANDLLAWSEGHDLDVFVPALLEEQDLRFFHAPGTGAGFALLRTASVAGISNAIPGDADPRLVWSDLATIAARSCPGLELVGYERGTDLAAATSAGFTTTGPLRVWMRDTGASPPRVSS